MPPKQLIPDEANWRLASLDAPDRDNAANTSTSAGKELRIMPLGGMSILTISRS
jgi:hypothetical protein